MFLSMRKRKNMMALFVIVLAFLSISLTTCDSPMGFGDSIDWEPPVLTLDPTPNPLYVKLGTKISGKVTDNVAVDRVIMRDAVSGEQLFRAVIRGDRFEITLDFSEEQNGEKIMTEVVAYDRAGNSGDVSIAFVTLIIDITPPLVENIYIQRSTTRSADVEEYNDLKELETTDRNGETIGNVNRYQNGWFEIKASLSENETRIERVELVLYDSVYIDTPVYRLEKDAGTSAYSPTWLLKEEDIIAAGSSLFGHDYKTEYDAGKRYYYRIDVVAYDMSGNESGRDQEEYFCLWKTSDVPKGVLDPLVVGTGTDLLITKGSTLPVNFFDDDQLLYAYAGLLTREQWNGESDISDGGVNLAGYDTNEKKLEALRVMLEAETPVYNWKYDRYSGTKEQIVNLTPTPVDSRIYYAQTGNTDFDHGDFVFFTWVKDNKLSPHSPLDGSLNITKDRLYNLQIVDENAPLIVFDKAGNQYDTGTGKSPEENTFPALDSSESGRAKFTVHGYTLREQRDGTTNQVVKLRMAWIPAGMNGGNPDGLIPQVRTALEKEDFSGLNGVQWWNMDAQIAAAENRKIDNSIAGSRYIAQLFSKTFDVLGGPDINDGYLVPGRNDYVNFNYNGSRENARKLFVFYAEDNMGHIVYSQLQLLGNNSPPNLQVYDITGRVSNLPDGIPNVYQYSVTGEVTSGYMTARQTYNDGAYNTLRDVAMPSGTLALGTADLAIPYRSYPKETNIIYWVVAEKRESGDLAISDIEMSDITNEATLNDKLELAYPEVGSYNSVDRALGFVEYFPEVSSRVFRFTATDQLGNEARIERTIAITSAATLKNITTSEQNGTYPAGKVIEIKANFDSQIHLRDNTDGQRPRLNLVYEQTKGTGNFIVVPVECDPVYATDNALALTFKFTVPQNAGGEIKTMYSGISSAWEAQTVNGVKAELDKPITVPGINNNSGNRIMDTQRNSEAFLPGYATGFDWVNDLNSLQYSSTNSNGKTIELDGVAPKITGIEISGKSPFTDTTNLYYFKSDETISFYVAADKSIRADGSPAIAYSILNTGSTATIATGENFSYARNFTDASKGTAGMIFSLNVNDLLNSLDANARHGVLSNVRLIDASTIKDDVGNNIDATTITASAFTTFLGSNIIRIDRVAPPAPHEATLSVSGTGTVIPTGRTYYNVNPVLTLPLVSPINEPWRDDGTREYTEDGIKWETYTTPHTLTNGSYNLQVRYVDAAGNIGATTGQDVEVNVNFPRLTSVQVKQPSATYKSGDTLDFTLNFSDDVRVATAANVTLTLADTTSTTHNSDTTVTGSTSTNNPSYQIQLTTVTSPTAALSTAVTFSWSLASNSKDMLNGLKITGMNLSGLNDRYGNAGPASGSIDTSTSGSVSIPSNDGLTTTTTTYPTLSGIKVSTISPRVTAYSPTNAASASGSNYTTAVLSDNRTIVLTFSKPVQKGNGTITIKPHGNYAIPSVFENDGYYLGINNDGTVITDSNGLEIKYSSSGSGRTYVDGFYDIFNKMTSTQQGYLIGSGTMRDPQLSQQTGLSAGPYQKYYHGLSQGAGFRGNYGNSSNTDNNGGSSAGLETAQWQTGRNAPGPRGTDYMVPDSSNVKWVLRYNVADIYSASDSTVTNIRSALTAAKFRWREIPVTANYVAVSTDGYTVTITLSDPLLPGLQWDLYYGAGTFTDMAGNQVAAINAANYWFLSAGVQKPVIRVERRSFDARSGANLTGAWSASAQPYNAANGYAGNIDSFLTLNYRIESETPTARLFYGTITGADNVGAATGAWTGAARLTSDTTTNANIVWGGVTNAKNSAPETIGTWVRQNLIFRNHANGAYSVYEAEGVTNSRNLGALLGTDGNVNTNRHALGNNSTTNTNGDAKTTANIYRRYYGFRSYNKDATIGELTAVTRAAIGTTPVQTASFTYTNRLTASKNYVAAEARVDHSGGTSFTAAQTVTPTTTVSPRAYEGVFRTVFLLYQTEVTGTDGAGSVKIAATNIGSGSSTIIFPMKDGEAETDGRTVRMLYRGTGNESGGGGTVPTNAYVFVSTEMVSQWFIQLHGNGGDTTLANDNIARGYTSYGVGGDVNDWISMGYGDLTFSMNVQTW